ncbi:MAG: hypothetical protein Q9175_005436, partial [Cornicularia normoerica]
WCGRIGAYGFKEEDHRKEHYKKVHGVDRNNTSMQIKRAGKQNTAREESVPSSDHAQPSGLSTEAVAGFWDLQPPCIYGNPADQERLELKVPVSDPDAVIPEALDANNVEPVEWTSTISDDVEMGSSDATKLSSGLDEGSMRERLEDGILDDLGARLECEQKHLTETPLNDNETCVASNSRHSSKDKLAVMKSQVLETLLASEAGQYCTSLKIQWDILGFMEDQYRDHDFPNASLGPVITISGSAHDAELEFDIIQGFMFLNIKSKTPDIIVDIVHQLLERVLNARGVEPAIFNVTFDMSSPGKEDQSAAKRSAGFSGANIGFQTMITGQLTFIMGKKDGRLHLSQKGPFQRIVQCAENTPVVLYDPADRRAWFVFGLHLMLHIIQTRHHLSPYNIDGQKVELTPVHPDKSKGAGTEAVAANKLRQLYECDTNAEKAYYFKDAILDIWSQMERLMEKENSIEACPGLALHGTMQSRIHGWEYMSLVHEKNYQRKEANIVKSSGGWVDLINDNDALVLFATGLDEIIKPVSNLSNLCRPWRSLPKGKDYLAAGVPILELLYSEAGSRISRKHLSTSHLQWHRGSTLFEQCKGTTSFRCECGRTQQIYHDSLLKTFGHVRPPGNLRENGCVIFGQAHHPFKLLNTTAIRQNAVHILPNTSIQNGDNTKQVSVGDDGLLSLSPLASVSPVPEEINYYTNRGPERPPSPVSSTEDTVHENVVVRRRNMSHIQTSNFDTRSGPNDGENELSLSDDCATLGYKSTLRHDTLFNGQYSGSTQTLCASKIEFRPVHTRKTLRHKSKMEDYSHRHGSSCKTSCKTCSTVDSEPPDSIERVSMSNGSQWTSKNAAERRER